MAGLVRADTELMLVAAEELQRVSHLMLEQFVGVRRAMQDLENSRWHGRHRLVIEAEWGAIASQFEPTAATLQDLAVRLKRTANALDAAALLFADPVATVSTGSAPSYFKWMQQMMQPNDWPRLGLSPTDPAVLLNMMLNTPTGLALWKVVRESYEQGQATLDTRLPADGSPPRIYIINGIDSDAVAGAPDKSALRLERNLEELGYNPQDVQATAAVYNTNLDTHLEGTRFGGWLSPLDALTATYAERINTAADAGNKLLGATQVASEYALGENGFYTQQTIDWINRDLQAHPLVQGQEVLIMSHSGGGAIAPSVAKALQRDNITTAGIVTMGSPVSNRDQASQYARSLVELRDQHDYIGLPLLRSAEGRAMNLALLSGALPIGAAVAAEVRNRDVRPNVTRATTSSGEGDTVSAHTSYWNSKEVVKIISTKFPAVGRVLQRQQEQKAKP